MGPSLKKFKTDSIKGFLIHLGVMASFLLILALLFFYAYLPGATNKDQTITVPPIEGMSINELEDFLGKRNLRWEVNDSSYSDEVPPLTILKQFPAAGSLVKENRKIFISVNRVQPPTVPVPNLIDGSLLNAHAVLKGNDLKPGKIQLKSSPFLNLVLEMQYQGRPVETGTRIPKGSIIDLVVGDGGSKDVAAPYVIGLTIEDAKVLLFGNNLNITVELIGDTLGVNPVILKQKPHPYENIRVGDVVELWVGKEGTPVPQEEDDLEDGGMEDEVD